MAVERAGKTRVVRVLQLPHAKGLALPAYQTADSAGLDLLAALPEGRPLKLKAGDRILVPTGLMLELPPGTEAQVRPRSGLALRHGITVLNSPGTIDSDYRGEVQVILVNLGQADFAIMRGERIAQLVVQRTEKVRLVPVARLAGSGRGAGGFGSTGTATAGENLPKRQKRKRMPGAAGRGRRGSTKKDVSE